jgi:hypothetical protein
MFLNGFDGAVIENYLDFTAETLLEFYKGHSIARGYKTLRHYWVL